MSPDDIEASAIRVLCCVLNSGLRALRRDSAFVLGDGLDADFERDVALARAAVDYAQVILSRDMPHFHSQALDWVRKVLAQGLGPLAETWGVEPENIQTIACIAAMAPR